ncbi:hypothetical protein ACB092_03G002600 [Castanea dentata]
MLLGVMCRLQGSKDNGLKKQLALGEHYSGFGTTYKAPQPETVLFYRRGGNDWLLKKGGGCSLQVLDSKVQEIDSSGSLEDCR